MPGHNLTCFISILRIFNQMRSITSVLGTLLVTLWLPLSAMAAEVEMLTAVRNPEPASSPTLSVEPLEAQQLVPLKGDIKLKAEPTTKFKRNPSAKPARISSLVDLAGEYVQTYATMIQSGQDGGKGVTIEAVDASTGAIKITNFFETGCTVNATADIETGKISIPNQYLFTNSTYGECDIAVITLSGNSYKIDRTSNIEGTINDDGSISITSYWGVFVKSGEYADNTFGLFFNTMFEKANGKMQQTRLVTTSTPFTEEVTSYNVVITQPSANILTVKNFANYGMTVDFILNRDETATIENQLARQDVTNGDWYTYAITYDASTGKLTNYTETITTQKASSNKKEIVWKDWSLFNTGSTKYYSGLQIEGKITADFDISYPVLSVSDFEGEGTEASPYLIKKLDDLVLLSDKVAATEHNASTPTGAGYARAFLGKYFRMENDIDMAGYRFTPIGADWNHNFAGTFDGGNHTLKNLTVSTGSAGYAALFGRADTVSVIKNLKFENPSIKGAGSNAGVVAGWSMGTIENCHVTGATVYNEGVTAAGIAGIGKIVTNCSVADSEITGLGGFAAGVAGEIDESIEDCNATGVTVYTYSATETYPSGGVVGSLYHASAKNCYFSGVVNSQKYYGSNLYLGGIAGTCYNGSIDNCFSVGTIVGVDTKSAIGGIVGCLYGNVTNSYSSGRVQDISSRYTGGITGYVRALKDGSGNQIQQSSVKNCYTSTAVSAETYMYKPEEEVRESLGTIEEGTSPVIENVYFDKQITNLTSRKYGATTAELTKASGITGFDPAVWTFTEGQYPRLKGIDDNEAAKMSASVIALADGNSLNKVSTDAELRPLGNTTYKFYKGGQLSDEGYYSIIAGDGKLKIYNDFGTDTLFVTNGKTSYYYIVKVAPIPFEGDGTELNPYLIKSKSDLITLSEVTTNSLQNFPDTYFKMTNDIDLEKDPAFLCISSNKDKADNQFNGKFDGGGFYIHNMLIDGIVWETKPEDDPDGLGDPATSESKTYCGVFGRLGAEGVVKNLNVAADCDITAWATLGAIVGYNYGTVDNCKNYADVTGLSCWIGGIVGQNLATGKITNCYNAGNIVSGYFNAGGIAGNTAGLIENCANVGDVTVKSISKFVAEGSSKLNYAGGITGTGSSSMIRNAVNAGNVYAAYSKAGGIAGSYAKASASSSATSGFYNDMENVVNFGSVSTADPELVGGISGASGTEGSIKNTYWDAQIIPYKANGNFDTEGMNGVETSVLTSGSALEGFSSELWQFNEGQYPVLKQFAEEEKLADARKVVVTMPTGVTAKDLSKNATLAVVDGLKWSLKRNEAFALAGKYLYAPESVNELTIDTLVATIGNYEKRIEIKRTPAVPLSGEGTEESPYLITSAADWNAMADYMESINYTFAGQFLKVANDIDFTDTEFKMIAASGAYTLQGTIDGDGKKISGIKYTTTDTDQGAIGIIGENAVIKNLTLAGEITSAKASTGGFAGAVYGTLINCVNEINVTSTKGNGVAGFGEIYSSARLTDCVNKATITGAGSNIAGIASTCQEGVEFVRCGNEGKIVNAGKGSYTAGLVGTAYPSRFEECYNTGEIDIQDTNNTKNVAGLIGYAQSTASRVAAFEFVKCYNTADISANAVVAGLVAQTNASATISNPMTFTECYNTGDVVAVSTKAVSSSPTAGIIAFFTAGSKFTGCWNSGTVMSQKNVYAGGIAGYYKYKASEETRIEFTECYNAGDIVASGNQGGGIIAYCSDYITIDKCYNTANIEGGFGLGGIAGNLAGDNSAIKSCWNTGNVTSSTYKAGGIIGFNMYTSTVTDCFNIGNISTTSTTGGTSTSTKEPSGFAIGGIAGQGAASFTNCYNMGTITGASQVGGILGTSYKNDTKLKSCYNAGKLVADADTCGALIGVNLNNGKLWTEENSVADCYYVTDNGEIGNLNTIGTATTFAELAKLDLGEGWNSGDDYTLPVPQTLVGVDCADVNSVYVGFAEGDSFESVTSDFFVGAPEGVAWTSSVPNITVSGSNATFSAEAFQGTATMTATKGEYSKSFDLVCDKKDAGVDQTIAGKTIVKEEYFTSAGVKVAKPANPDGAVYMVVRTYDDGSTKVFKLFNTK